MSKEIKNNSNYFGTVVKIRNLRPIKGADNIQIANVAFNDVIVSKDIKEGDLMIYVQSGTQVCEDLCFQANLYDKAEMNIDNNIKGYVDPKKRVIKAIKLKGEISNGILIALDKFDWLEEDFKEGDMFTHVNGKEIFTKYVVKQTRVQGVSNKQKQIKKFDKIIDKYFKFHEDTSNLRFNIHKIQPDDIISLHYKKHGTSAVFANILVNKQLTWYERLLKKLGINVVDKQYDIIYSSRKVIKNGNAETGFYSTDVWGEIYQEVKDRIPKGYTLYGEIIGYESSGSYIQKDFDYGCQVGEKKFYVYRITNINEDGLIIELTDEQIKDFCEHYGFLYQDTYIYYGRAKDLYKLATRNVEMWREHFLRKLEEDYNEKDCYMCSNIVPEEGIILRKEKTFKYEAYKLKSKRFLLGESNNIESTNLEDNQ